MTLSERLPKSAAHLESNHVRDRSRYARYRDSGVAWLGEIPEHWRVQPLKRAVAINPESLPEDTDPSYEFHYVDIGNGNDRGETTATEELRFEDAPSRARRIVRIGDTFISTVRTYLRAIGFVDTDQPSLVVSTGFAVLRPGPELHPRFLWRLVQSTQFVDAVVAHSVGVSYPAIAPTTLGTLPVWIPPIPEQRAIVAFLDRETARIDRLIAKKERLIELLHERRAALINQAVTKGLDPGVPMKDSGIEWIGAMPEHWHVMRLKYVASGTGCGVQIGPFGGMLKDLSTEPTGYKIYGQENIINNDFALGHRWVSEERYLELKSYAISSGDILLTRKGSIGNCRLVPEFITPGIMDSDTIRIRANPSTVRTQFLVTLLHDARYLQEQVALRKRGAVLSGLNTTTVEELVLLLPPLSEQDQILEHLDRQDRMTSQLVQRLRMHIQLLREYRTALISAAVTGKIDVREEVAV